MPSLEERRAAFQKNVKKRALRDRLIARSWAHSHFCGVLRKKDPTAISRRILEKVLGELPKPLLITEGRQFLDETVDSFADDDAVIGVLEGEVCRDNKEVYNQLHQLHLSYQIQK